METAEVSNEQGMQLRVAFLHWAICLGILVMLVFIAATFNVGILGTLAFIFYFGAGFYLSRSVLRRIIDWHPMYDTLYNVTSEKLRFFFLWPITYLFLFMRLGINKIL